MIRMSKFVCSHCNHSLSTKHALERHIGSARCTKNQRDNAKEKLNDVKDNELDGRIWPSKEYNSTIFRTVLGRNILTPIRKRYHEQTMSSEDGFSSVTISEHNTVGHVIHNLVLSVSDFRSLVVKYCDEVILDLERESLLMMCPPDAVNITNIIFGNNIFVPLGNITIELDVRGVLGGEVSGEAREIGKLRYITYVLNSDEARRQHLVPRQILYNCYTTQYSTEPTIAHVAEIFYKNCSPVPELCGFNGHYCCLPDTVGDRMCIDDTLFASLVPKGCQLFDSIKPNGQVLVRYIAQMDLEDGQIYAYHDLYKKDPRVQAIELIAERLRLSKDGIVSTDKIYVGSEPRSALVRIYNQHIIAPVSWADTPLKSKYGINEPDWTKLNNREVSALLPNIAKLVEKCNEGKCGFFRQQIDTPTKFIDGTTRTNNFIYIMSYYNGKCYGLTDLDIEAIKLHVPLDPEIHDVLLACT